MGSVECEWTTRNLPLPIAVDSPGPASHVAVYANMLLDGVTSNDTSLAAYPSPPSDVATATELFTAPAVVQYVL